MTALPAPLAARLNQLFQSADWDTLVGAAEDALREHPRAALAWKALGMAQLRRAAYVQAEAALERAIELTPDDPDAHNSLGIIQRQLGRPEAALASFQRSLAAQPGFALAHTNLGMVLNELRRHAEAAASCRTALALNSGLTAAHNNLAIALAWSARGQAAIGASGRVTAALWEDAERSVRQALALDPLYLEATFNLGDILEGQGRDGEAVAAFAEAVRLAPRSDQCWSRLALAQARTGEHDRAVGSYRQALKLRPEIADVHCNLSHSLSLLGRIEEAEVEARHALALEPEHCDALVNLGVILNERRQFSEAAASFRRALAQRPDSARILFALGKLLAQFASADDESAPLLERAVAIAPGLDGAWIELGNIQMRAGRERQALDSYRRAQSIQPLVTWPARPGPAAFSVLLLDAPGPGKTPRQYLLGTGNYDRHFFVVLPDTPAPLALLAARADVVFNLVSDADAAGAMLPAVQALAGALGRPVLNHPAAIAAGDRATVARRLAGIPGCRIPHQQRFAPGELARLASAGAVAGFSLPVIVRVAGTHGGDDMERASSWSEVAEFCRRHGGAGHYLCEFVEYRSDDGRYRKYRLINIDGIWLPYHLAVHDDWKVHYFRTDMAERPESRNEEAAFLAEPAAALGPLAWSALDGVTQAIGLDYSGIDCGLDQDGRLLVFETNATMLVHDEVDPVLAYKNAPVARIKAAFDAMLARHARAGRPRS